MNAPPPGDPQTTERIARVLEDWAKIAGAVIGLWAVFHRIIKPYQQWRRQHFAAMLAEVLGPELKSWRDTMQQEQGCAERMEELLREMKSLFADSDKLLEIAKDNRERHDEHDLLLDTVFGLDRRIDPDRRAAIDQLIRDLSAARKERQREAGDPTINTDEGHL